MTRWEVRTTEERTYLEDLTEEESRAMDNDPEIQKQLEKVKQELIERQLKLRQAEQNSSPSEKKA